MNNEIKKNRRFCSYKGCSSDRLTTRNGAITFFGFPVKDTERCSIWISNSGREEFRFLTPRELSEKRVCELHFDRIMFSNDFKTNLRRSAFPMDWRLSNPECIQIDDDEEVAGHYQLGDECDSGIVSEGSCNNNNENSVNGHLNTDRVIVTEVNIQANGNTSSNSLSDGANVISSNKSLQESSPTGPSLGGNQTLVITNSLGKSGKSRTDREVTSKTGLRNKKNTKFHNLPPQTTQTDFYYQQCLSAEETNNSFPEPPDGELPLFVQQNSVVSLADEPANSEISEPASKKRKHERDNDNLAHQMRDAMTHLKNITALLTNTEDEFELFGRSVALQLKKMSICTALTVQAKIQHLLSLHRISDIKKDAHNKTALKDNFEKNPSEEKTSEEEEEGEEQPMSPHLSLTCASEASENETTELN